MASSAPLSHSEQCCEIEQQEWQETCRAVSRGDLFVQLFADSQLRFILLSFGAAEHQCQDFFLQRLRELARFVHLSVLLRFSDIHQVLDE